MFVVLRYILNTTFYSSDIVKIINNQQYKDENSNGAVSTQQTVTNETLQRLEQVIIVLCIVFRYF